MAHSSVDKIICPDLDEFVKTTGTVELKWYKEFFPLLFVEGKHQYNRGDRFLLIRDLTAGDEGYYTCELTFPYNKAQYKVTRTIHLQITAAHTRPKIIDPLNSTIKAALGSSLIVPCKVFTAIKSTATTEVSWLANGIQIEDSHMSNRVSQGPQHVLTENESDYIEVELVFNVVRVEDFSTEFKCVAKNSQGSHESPVQIHLADSSSTCVIVGFFGTLSFLTVVCIFMCNLFKPRCKKDYVLTKS
ncbi:UNVERIFIED_CONTAM: hypothetical protein FKN15_043112 [Acipenser sinensis]